MRTTRSHRGLLLGALAVVCLLLAAAAPAAAGDAPAPPPAPGDSSELNPPPIPAPAAPLDEPPAQPPADDEAAPPEGDTAPPAGDPAPPEGGQPSEGAEGEAEPEGDTAAEGAPAEGEAAAETAAPIAAPEPADITVEGLQPRQRRRLSRWPISGTFRLNYRLRHDGDESDNDLYQYLILNIGDEDRCGWSFSFHGRLTEDLDGRSDKDEFFVFDSITDTYNSRVNGRLYHAYANYRPRGGSLRLIRIGRQWVEGGDLFHVDGVRADFGNSTRADTAAFGATIYGGQPAHLFEGWPDGDVVVGASIFGRPWTGGHARLDYVYINDETNYYGTEEAHLVTLTVRQRFQQNMSWWGSYQHLNDDPRAVRLGGNLTVPHQDLSVRGAFYGLLTTQNERVIDIDPYFAVNQELNPYFTADVSVAKGLWERLYLEAGVAARRLFEDSDEGVFNREFTRWWGAASLDDWPWCGTNITITGERWISADDAWTVTADFEYRPSKRFKLQFGTDYSAYRFDFYTANERQSVRGYYVRVVMRTSERWRLHLRARLEDDKFDTYFTLNTGFQVEF